MFMVQSRWNVKGWVDWSPPNFIRYVSPIPIKGADFAEHICKLLPTNIFDIPSVTRPIAVHTRKDWSFIRIASFTKITTLFFSHNIQRYLLIMGFCVFKGGIQKWIKFWPKIRIVKGFFLIVWMKIYFSFRSTFFVVNGAFWYYILQF